MNNIYAATADQPVIGLTIGARAKFIARTYTHLFGAIAIFTLLEVALFSTGMAETIALAMLGTSPLIVFGGFVLVSWVATHAAGRARSLPAQYAGLAGFILVEAIFFLPLLWMANTYVPGAISNAAVVSLFGFAGLTFIAFWTRKDFSFLGAVLRWVILGAVLGIVASLIFGFSLGIWFSVGMVVVAGAAILYDTSNVLHHYPEDRYVGAALALFASVAMMFFYVLRIFTSRN